MAHRNIGYRFENDWTEKQLRDIHDTVTSAMTVPVNVTLSVKQKVIDMGRMEKLLRDAKLIVLQVCYCRKKRRNCKAPLETCILLDDLAESTLKDNEGDARKVSLEEALDAMRKSHEAGLVHMAYITEGNEKINPICSCCSCCCHILSGIVRFGLDKDFISSDFVTETIIKKCAHCGACADKCHFGARKMEKSKLSFEKEKCIGCGLCLEVCPTHAIELKSVPAQ